MDTQRTVLWFVFGLSLILLWDRWQVYQGHHSMLRPSATAPAAPAPAAPAARAPGEVPAPAAQATAPAPAAAAASGGGQAPAGTAAPGSERIHIQTDVMQVDFDPVGATLVRVELSAEKPAPDWTQAGLARLLGLTSWLHSMGFGHVGGGAAGNGSRVVLLDTSAGRTYQAQTGLIGGSPEDPFPNHRSTRFEVTAPARALGPGQDTLTVRFEAQSGGVRLVKTFTFRRGHYDIRVEHQVTNVGAAPVTPSLYLQLVRDGGKPVEDSSFYRTYTGPAFYSDAQKYRKVSFEDIDKKKSEDFQPADNGWVAMVQHYFVAAWVPARGVSREFYASEHDRLYSDGLLMKLGTLAPGAGVSQQATLYVGPQDEKALEAISPGLELVADYGWLTPIAKPLFLLLGALHWLVGNWGWSIVLLTVLIKAAFYPLSAASFKSMAKMKELQPRLVKLREQYGEDRQKLQLAMMELYKQEKINPVMGCLPMLVQIPVFIALYWVLLASVEMRNAPWMLWIHDLSTPDPWFVLPVVMMGSMWIQYKLNPTPPDPVQAKMMAIMPFVFGAMFFFFPAGLVLYWIVNNALSILQQWRITTVVARAKKVG
jgi:YidC/Oxa1 family membrane protein insertase